MQFLCDDPAVLKTKLDMSRLRKAFITKGNVQVQEAEINMPGGRMSRVVVEECKSLAAKRVKAGNGGSDIRKRQSSSSRSALFKSYFFFS